MTWWKYATPLRHDDPTGDAYRRALTELTGEIVLLVSAQGKLLAPSSAWQAYLHHGPDDPDRGLERVLAEQAAVASTWQLGIASEQPFSFRAAVRHGASGGARQCELRVAPLGERSTPEPAWLVLVRECQGDAWLEGEMAVLMRLARESHHDETLTRLAGGFAHNFNNLLQAIIGDTELALRRSGDLEHLQHRLTSILSSVRRGGELCAQLLAYSGRTQLGLEPCDVSQLIADLEPRLRERCAGQAKLSLEIATALPVLEGDPELIRLAVLNLVTNSMEATRARPGSIVVSVSTRYLAAHELGLFQANHLASPGLFLMIEVADDGDGIRPELLPHVFQPFVSSKFQGRGLGLSAVAGVARSFGGAVRATSDNRGTRVQLALPTAGAGISLAGQRLKHTQKESVLLVDTRFVRRGMARLVLESLGLHVLLAADVENALAMTRAHVGALPLAVVAEHLMSHDSELRRELGTQANTAIISIRDADGTANHVHGLPGPTVRATWEAPWGVLELASLVSAALAEQRLLRNRAVRAIRGRVPAPARAAS